MSELCGATWGGGAGEPVKTCIKPFGHPAIENHTDASGRFSAADSVVRHREPTMAPVFLPNEQFSRVDHVHCVTCGEAVEVKIVDHPLRADYGSTFVRHECRS